MLHYKLYQNKQATSKTFGKWYGRAVNSEIKNIDGLAEHMAYHNTPFSKGVIKGIITDMVSCIRELALNGIAVKLDDLAIFSVGIKTTPANSAAEFSATSNLNGYRLRARATGQFSPAELATVASISEQDEYKVDKTAG